jgi:hypothetical protein
MMTLACVAVVCLALLIGEKLWIGHRERSHARALEHRPVLELEQRLVKVEHRLAGIGLAPLAGRKYG